jgi:DedD protein
MVLDHEPRQKPENVQVHIPPPVPLRAEGGSSEPASPAPAAPASLTADQNPQAAAPAPQVATPAPAGVQDVPAPASNEGGLSPKPGPAKPAGAPSHASAKTAPPNAKTGNGGFVIQLGAFSDPDNAKQLHGKLKAARIAVYSETVNTPQGARTRVRAGPYPTREAAEKVREHLRQLKLIPGVSDAKIVPKGE